MPTIEKMPARNPNERWAKEHCEGEVSEPTRQWALRCGRKPICSFRASYIVNGKKLCERHAGKALIHLTLEDQAQEEAIDQEQEHNYNRDIQQSLDRVSRR